MGEFKFNLLDEPWIHCIDKDGNQIPPIGLKDLFEKADSLLQVTDQNPLTEFSIVRILLAIVHRALEGPKNLAEWSDIYTPGKFDIRVTDYLEKFRHRFNLFSTDYPFYQTPGLYCCEKGDIDKPSAGMPVASIVYGKASGNNKTAFDHTTDDKETRISPAEAARALATAQMFSLRGLCRKTTNHFGYLPSFNQAAMTRGVHIVLRGKDLFETLMLNLLVYDKDKPIPRERDSKTLESLDRPVWEENDPRDKGVDVPPKGYLDYLTCKCRHILIVPEKEKGTVFVRRIHMAQGKMFQNIENPVAVRKKSKDNSYYHPNLDLERMLWRDSQSLFAFDKEDLRPMILRNMEGIMKATRRNGERAIPLQRKFLCMAYGIAYENNNPLSWRKEEINVPAELLSGGLSSYLVNAMELVSKGEATLRSGIGSFIKNYGERGRDLKPGLEKEIYRYYWDRMEGHFHKLLSNMADQKDGNFLEQWKADIVATAREALRKTLENRYRNSYKAWVAALGKLNLGLQQINP